MLSSLWSVLSAFRMIESEVQILKEVGKYHKITSVVTSGHQVLLGFDPSPSGADSTSC